MDLGFFGRLGGFGSGGVLLGGRIREFPEMYWSGGNVRGDWCVRGFVWYVDDDVKEVRSIAIYSMQEAADIPPRTID